MSIFGDIRNMFKEEDEEQDYLNDVTTDVYNKLGDRGKQVYNEQIVKRDTLSIPQNIANNAGSIGSWSISQGIQSGGSMNDLVNIASRTTPKDNIASYAGMGFGGMLKKDKNFGIKAKASVDTISNEINDWLGDSVEYEGFADGPQDLTRRAFVNFSGIYNTGTEYTKNLKKTSYLELLDETYDIAKKLNPLDRFTPSVDKPFTKMGKWLGIENKPMEDYLSKEANAKVDNFLNAVQSETKDFQTAYRGKDNAWTFVGDVVGSLAQYATIGTITGSPTAVSVFSGLQGADQVLEILDGTDMTPAEKASVSTIGGIMNAWIEQFGGVKFGDYNILKYAPKGSNMLQTFSKMKGAVLLKKFSNIFTKVMLPESMEEVAQSSVMDAIQKIYTDKELGFNTPEYWKGKGMEALGGAVGGIFGGGMSFMSNQVTRRGIKKSLKKNLIKNGFEEADANFIADDMVRQFETNENNENKESEYLNIAIKNRIENSLREDGPQMKMSVEEESGTTLKTLEKLKGRKIVSKQFILDLTNSGDIKQVERDMIRKELEGMPDKINIEEFTNRVKTNLIPLYRSGEGEGPSLMYENVALQDEERGDVENYNAHVYESPIENSAGGVHFDMDLNPNYFAHTRVEDMADGETRRVIEIQSDLFQKGGLEKKIRPQGELDRGYDYDYKKLKRNLSIHRDQLDVDTVEAYEKVEEQRNKLKPYRDTYHERIIREEIKQAAQDGKSKIQIPVGKTAMKIEGLYQEGDIADWEIDRGDGYEPLVPNMLEEGLKIMDRSNDHWIITQVGIRGEFRAVPFETRESYITQIRDYHEMMGTEADMPTSESDIDEAIKEMQEETVGSEGFSVHPGAVNIGSPIYRFYEKTIGKFVKNKYNAQRVTDERGIEWWEIDVKESYGKDPVQAFRLGRKGKSNVTKKELIAKLNEILPKGTLTLKVVEEILEEGNSKGNVKKLGSYFNKIITVLGENGLVSDQTGYHEAFHQIWDMSLTRQEKAGITREIYEKYPEKIESYSKKYNSGVAQEVLADLFADYIKGQTNNKPTTFTGKILEFFEKLFEYFSNIDTDNIDAVFDKIAQGEMVSRETRDSGGEKFSSLEDLTKSPNFKSWFGDSKVVDDEGNPLVVYHGTNQEFSNFDKGMLGNMTKASSAEKGFFFTDSKGEAKSYSELAGRTQIRNQKEFDAKMDQLNNELDNATRNRNWDEQERITEEISDYEISFTREDVKKGLKVYETYLRIEDLMIVDFGGEGAFDSSTGGISKLIIEAKAKGHDGIMLKNILDSPDFSGKPTNHYVAFDPNQIKSVDNKGGFSIYNDNIYMSTSSEQQGIYKEALKYDSAEEFVESQSSIAPNKKGYSDEFKGRTEYKEAIQELQENTGEVLVKDTIDISKLEATQTTKDIERLTRVRKEINDGIKNPLVVEYQSPNFYTVMDGNTRLGVYKELGIKKVPIVVNKSGAKNIKTKQQLTEIYNKAHEGKMMSVEEEVKTKKETAHEEYERLQIKLKEIDNNRKELELTKGEEYVKVITKRMKELKVGRRYTKEEYDTQLKDIKNFISKTIKIGKLDKLNKRELNKLIAVMRDTTYTPQKLEKAYKSIVKIQERLDKDLYTQKIDKLIKRSTPTVTSGRKTGKLGHSQKMFDYINLNRNMTQVHVDARLGAIMESENITPESMAESVWLQMIPTKKMSLDQLKSIYEELLVQYDKGRAEQDIKDFNRQSEKQLTKEAVKDLQEADPKRRQISENNFGKIKKTYLKVRDFMNANFGLEYLLDVLDESDKTTKEYGGLMVKFNDRLLKAQNEREAGLEKVSNTIAKKAQEIWGKKVAGAFVNNKTKKVQVNGEWFTQNELAKRYQEFKDPTLNKTFEEMGYTQEKKAAMVKALDPKLKEFSDWLVKDFYPAYYDRINPVYREKFGIDMPKNKFYSPIARVGFDTDENSLMAEDNRARATANNKSLKLRMGSSLELKKLDVVNTVSNHIQQMEHFIALSGWSSEAQSVFRDPQVAKLLKRNQGEDFYSMLMDAIDASINDKKDGKTYKALDTIRGNIALGMTSLSPTIFIKQLTSIPAMWQDVKMIEAMKYSAVFLANPRKAFKELKEASAMFRQRGGHIDRDLQIALGKNLESIVSKKTTIKDIMGMPTKVGDQIAIALGGYAVYRATLAKTGSKDQAMQQFNKSYNRSQQSGAIQYQSFIERSGGSIGKLFSMFMSTPKAYTSIMLSNVRNLKAGRISKKQFTKTFVIQQFLLPMIFQFISSGFKWDDEDMMWAVLLSPLRGFIGVRNIINTAVDWYTGKPWWKTTASGLPVFSPLLDMFDGIDGLQKDDISMSDIMIEVAKIIDFGLTPMSGIDLSKTIKTGTQMLKAPENWRYALGFSNYTVDGPKKKKNTSKKSDDYSKFNKFAKFNKFNKFAKFDKFAKFNKFNKFNK